MRKVPGYVAAIALLFLLPMAASAESQCSFGVKFTPVDVAPITLYFREVPIRVIFDVIGKLSGTQFRVLAGLDYNVTFDIRRVPACHVLEIIGESQSLTYRQDGDAIVVIPPEPAPPPPVRPSTAPKQQ